MKKLTLLILLVLVASTLVAAIPTKMVRLTVINKSGYDVMIKLEGSELTEGFYYLTIPAGTRDAPTYKVFTIQMDLYTRTTWQCGGVPNTGSFWVQSNVRLTFLPCGEFACASRIWWRCLYGNRCDGTCLDMAEKRYQRGGAEPDWATGYTDKRRSGEPGMEKIQYFKYLYYYKGIYWSIAYKYAGMWNYGCNLWAWRIRSYQLPLGCAWRYQY